MVENKIFRTEKKWKETNPFVTSETRAGICGNGKDEQTWQDVVMKKFKYYYDLEGVCGDRAAYRPKVTSAEITVTSYAPNNDSQSSDSNGDDDGSKEASHDKVPGNVRTNLNADGLYSTPPDSRSRLKSNTSTTNAKKARKRSKTSSKKKGRKTSASSFASNATFDHAATKFMNQCYGTSAQTTVSEEPKSKKAVAAKDAALLSTHFKTCVDNFGSRVLDAWSCKDSCEQFKNFLTPAERKEFKQMEQDALDDVSC